MGDEFRKAIDSHIVDIPSGLDLRWFPDSVALATALHDAPLSGNVVLVKGSRGIMMEKALPEL